MHPGANRQVLASEDEVLQQVTLNLFAGDPFPRVWYWFRACHLSARGLSERLVTPQTVFSNHYASILESRGLSTVLTVC